MSENDQAAVKDEDAEHPVASVWRPTFREIALAFAEGDFRLERGIDSVEPVSEETANQIRDYIADYGETLVALPDETWESSVAQWQGTHWDVLVDLWTEGEGRSDLAQCQGLRDRSGVSRRGAPCLRTVGQQRGNSHAASGKA